ncbi:3-hydroxyacyl-ACP dehydratase FabZ [Dethiosulfatarculus sandiegensis]|uniref:3-hydroxyacyl-ACP dehydratase FabZ n=1 Tax=Dethiosulfatarculus sandiegensis TaxID=1429043 RepID=UPI0005CB3A9A|nr:3-hydroxyacyl-ACP dehydratase FabZ [Dethiosulfatarculus sandiegensis]
MAEQVFDLQEIMTFLPHRYPFLLVDRILELEKGKRIKGLKNVTYGEHFFQGHFPDLPVMPGVLIIEAMAQTGGVMAYQSLPDVRGKIILFMSIDKVKFRRPVVPGDQLILEVTNVHRSARAWKMSGKAMVDGQLAAQADLTAAVTSGK